MSCVEARSADRIARYFIAEACEFAASRFAKEELPAIESTTVPMKLGDIARVARGVSTGNRGVFVMSREQASERGVDRFVRPVIASSKEVRDDAILRDGPQRSVILLADQSSLQNEAVRAYLGGIIPRTGTYATAPIVATYVGVPCFAANPDELVVLNSLYRVIPRTQLAGEDILALVTRLNISARAWIRGKTSQRRSPRAFEALEL